MSERRSLQALDRLIRVREIRARQAMAAAGRAETRRRAEAALVERVELLLVRPAGAPGPVSAQAASARAAGDAVLGALADDSRARLAATLAEQGRLAQALARARAAVDAAVSRRCEREGEA
ncbi:hypothetical protein [Polymorphobacter fuscus]|uniref:Uncharacterized protein n=1 Tax=Sandarakinorhabdus fusca TaxID=1439888 RepID=A0A7C9KGP2_9SPHN|nr:hypothetical protein [Polymorphobacter fuscus]KAB7648328.1 hypothetical protein F9290_00995 [Polymorphobacter fuscus]MQT15841.1 hypothetical protein [Polymorphobacter fuscus]NJC07885.1 hypothetical protein [Polymorphobacter fuscus]